NVAHDGVALVDGQAAEANHHHLRDHLVQAGFGRRLLRCHLRAALRQCRLTDAVLLCRHVAAAQRQRQQRAAAKREKLAARKCGQLRGCNTRPPWMIEVAVSSADYTRSPEPHATNSNVEPKIY